jgi:hypothetical protein
MSSDLDKLLGQFKIVAGGGTVERPKNRFTSYAVTNFRGGIGKSTLAFNLAWEVSRSNRTLLLDLCPQRNFTQSLGPVLLANPKLGVVGCEYIQPTPLEAGVPVRCWSAGWRA